MSPGGTVRIVEPEEAWPTPRGIALMLPGRAYTCEMSLLAWSTRALRAVGFRVHQVGWELGALPPDATGFVVAAAEAAEAAGRLREATLPVLVVAKSLGTLAAPWAADRGYPAAWLTPVLDHADVAAALADYPAPSLVVAGTADPFWRRGFRGAGATLEIEGADHVMDLPDWRDAIACHERVADAVGSFAANLRSPSSVGDAAVAGA